MQTAVAIVVWTTANQPLAGAIAYLQSPTGFLFAITNQDGYAIWPEVTLPFAGRLQLAGAAAYYQEPVTISDAVANVTIRVGASPSNPQDIKLPACAPFRRALLPPTREEVCAGQTTQQGLYVTTQQFGQMPWWGACWAWLTSGDRALAAQQLQAHGDTVCLVGVPSGAPLYDEPGQFYSADQFPALAMTDAQIVDLVAEAVGLGFRAVWLFLGGDTDYGLACQQVEAIAPLLGPLNAYVLYVPGWDGVWHAPGGVYTPEQVQSFAARARAAGALYVGLEHGTGYLPVGGGAADFLPGGKMTGYDVILGEFNSGEFDGTVWQVLGRMIDPYIWPPNQPAGSDSNPAPKYLAPGSPRGPYVYRVFEYYIYEWVRGASAATVAAAKQYFIDCGAEHVC